MITRRNWLLRCSILTNVVVLLYVVSQLLVFSNDGLPTDRLLAIGAAAIAAKADNGQRDLLQQAEAAANGGPADASDREENSKRLMEESEVFAAAVAAEQQQQQQLQQQAQPGEPEENRFEVPSDSEHPDAAAVVAVAGVGGSVDSHAEETAAANKDDGGGDSSAGDVPVPGIRPHLPAAGIESDTEAKLQQLIECHNKEYASETVQRGDFWVLKNFVPAEHGELRCFETVTYTTHADYTFLDNLIPLLQRWQAPVSIAMHAPGTDFAPTIRAIRYLRDCAPDGALVRRFATFHMYFSSKHIPKIVPRNGRALDQLAPMPFNCSLPAAYENVSSVQLYKTQKKLLYPVNVGRNVARDAAQTHFVLASDIELYPNPGLPQKFLDMMARNDAPLQRSAPKVWPLSIFEVDASSQVPRDKTELQALLKAGKAIPFHKRVCASCHGVPKSKEWMAANETDELGIFHIGKRIGYFVHWEPIYIGTHADPHYDERLSWEGKSDKMTQGYALCALDYEFQILDNAFLVHKPGIKVLKKDTKRAMLAAKTNQLIRKIIYPELQVMYGTRTGCTV